MTYNMYLCTSWYIIIIIIINLTPIFYNIFVYAYILIGKSPFGVEKKT